MAATVLALMPSAADAARPVALIVPGRSIGGVALGMSAAQVRALYGVGARRNDCSDTSTRVDSVIVCFDGTLHVSSVETYALWPVRGTRATNQTPGNLALVKAVYGATLRGPYPGQVATDPISSLIETQTVYWEVRSYIGNRPAHTVFEVPLDNPTTGTFAVVRIELCGSPHAYRCH